MRQKQWWFFLLCMVFSSELLAWPDEYRAGVGLLGYHYKEFDDSNLLLDREDGVMPGLLLGLSWSGQTWSHELFGQYHLNLISYTGQTQTGVPVSTDSRADIFDMHYLATRTLRQNSQFRFDGRLGMGFRYWRRDIRPGQDSNGDAVSGLLEHYYWPYLAGGVEIHWPLRSDITSGFSIVVRRMFNARMMVDFAGSEDDLTVNLGNRWGFRAAAPTRWVMDNHKTLIIEPYIEYIDIGKSNVVDMTSGGVPTGSVLWEPRSTTRNLGLQVSVQW